MGGFPILCPILTFAWTLTPPDINMHILHVGGGEGDAVVKMCVSACTCVCVFVEAH